GDPSAEQVWDRDGRNDEDGDDRYSRISEDKSCQSHPGPLQAAIALANLRPRNVAEDDGRDRGREQEQPKNPRDQTPDGFSAGCARLGWRRGLRIGEVRLSSCRDTAATAKLAVLLKRGAALWAEHNSSLSIIIQNRWSR